MPIAIDGAGNTIYVDVDNLPNRSDASQLDLRANSSGSNQNRATIFDRLVGDRQEARQLLRDQKSRDVTCPFCKREYARKTSAVGHLTKPTCPIMKTHYKRKGAGAKKPKRIKPEHRGIYKTIVSSDVWPLVRSDPRECLYIAGPSGSGKSYYTSKYIEKFLDEKPGDVLILSRITDDASFEPLMEKYNTDEHERIWRIPLDETLLPSDEEDEIDWKGSLAGSLVIFDDIDTTDKEVGKYVAKVRDILLKQGRDQTNSGKDVFMAMTNHQISDYRKTRDTLLESTSVTLFPRSGATGQIERVLKTYLGLKKPVIEYLIDVIGQDSRWVSIYTTYPRYVLHQNGAFLL